MIRVIRENSVVRYLLVGVYNVGFTFFIYSMLLFLVGATAHIQLIYWISALLGIINGFIFQKRFVWKDKQGWKSQIVKFLTLNLCISGLNSVALFVFVTQMRLNPYVSQLTITLVLIIFSYFVSRYWVFKNKNSV